MIQRSESLHDALQYVADHTVVFHPGWTSHVQGYAWRDGGDMPVGVEQSMRSLASLRLVAQIPACVCKQVACEVVLTLAGTALLAEWTSAAVDGSSVASGRP